MKQTIFLNLLILLCGCSIGGSASSDVISSFTIPYVDSITVPGTDILNDPKINVTVFGAPLTPNLDTGSRGFYVTQNLLPTSINLNGISGSIFYWSSGRQFNGIWVTTEVIFSDAIDSKTGESSVAKATIPVLIVQSISCLAGSWPNSCGIPITSPTTSATDIADTNMGIGFDRTGHQQVPENDQNNQQYNSFLNLDQMKSGMMRAGYVLGLQNVQLGLTPANTAGGFAYGKLAPTGYTQVPGSPPDWQPATGNITLISTNGQLMTYPTGEAVIDIGISNMLLTLQGQPTTGTLSSGSITVSLFGSNGFASYTFIPGESNTPVTPSSVDWTAVQPGLFSQNQPTFSNNFVNTGRDVLNCFDYLYDAAAGYVGLRLNHKPSCSDAHVTAATRNPLFSTE